MSNITQPTNFGTIPPEQLQQYLDKFAKDVVSTVNGRLDFGNFSCQLLSVNFTQSNLTIGFVHSLKRVPVGYLPYSRSFSGVIYDGVGGNTALRVYLQASAVGTANLILF